MQTPQPSLLMRDDTFFGVCEGLGEDFGFNPLYLRVTLAVLLLWYPVATLAAYALGGVIVLLGRWLFPAAARAKVDGRDGTAGTVAARAVSDPQLSRRDGGVDPDEYSAAA